VLMAYGSYIPVLPAMDTSHMESRWWFITPSHLVRSTTGLKSAALVTKLILASS